MKNVPLFAKIFVSFIAISLVPLILVGGMINTVMLRFAQDEIQKSASANLQNVKKVTGVLADITMMDAARLSLNRSLDDLRLVKNFSLASKDPDSVLLLASVYNNMLETFHANSKLHSIYVYIEEFNQLITTNRGIVPMDSYLRQAWYTTWKGMPNSQGGVAWVSPPQSESDIPPVVSFLYPFNNLVSGVHGVLVFNMYENELSKLLNADPTSEGGYVFIMSADGKIISHPDKRFLGTEPDPAIVAIASDSRDKGSLNVKSEPGTQLVLFDKSSNPRWTYVSVYPLETLMKKATALRNTLMVSLSLLMLLGLCISWIIARRLSNPVRQLMQDIISRRGSNLPEGGGNEMAVIGRAFEAMSEQGQALAQKLERHQHQIWEKYLADVLREGRGVIQTAPPDDLGFVPGKYAAVIIAIDRYERFLERYTQEQHYYYKVLILSTCEVVLAPGLTSRGLIYGRNELVLVVNAPTDSENPSQLLLEGLSQIQSELEKVFEHSLSIGVGHFVDELPDIHISYEQSVSALKERFFSGNGLIHPAHAAKSDGPAYYYPAHLEKHLLNFLQRGNRDDVEGLLGQLMQELREQPGMTADKVLEILMQLVGTTVRMLAESNINVSDIFGSGYNLYPRLASKETLDEMYTWLLGFYAGIMEFSTHDQAEGKKHSAKVLSFINERYHDNIDTTAIADATGVKYSSVGRIVKSATGKTVIDYINGLRIAEAKQLLRETTLNVGEIALKIGYNNDQSFTRFFKKYEGITPGEFRQMP